MGDGERQEKNGLSVIVLDIYRLPGVAFF